MKATYVSERRLLSASQLCYIYVQKLSYSISIDGWIEWLRYAFRRNNVGRRNDENEWTDRWMNVPDARARGGGAEGWGEGAGGQGARGLRIPFPFLYPSPILIPSTLPMCRERTNEIGIHKEYPAAQPIERRQIPHFHNPVRRWSKNK